MTTVRALICADSPVYAAALRRMLEHEGDIKVAFVCGRAEDAIAALPTVNPDLVAMDLWLPGMDGLQAVEEIMSSRPLPIVVLMTATADQGEKAAAVLAAGALDAIVKEDLDLVDPASPAASAFRRRARTLSNAQVIRHPRARLPRPAMNHYASVIGICASAGGPRALARVLAELPADYAIPILVVQHMATGFTEGLASWLNHIAAIPVAVAPAGERVTAGVWIAPEQAHLTLGVTGRFRFDTETVAGPHRPSGDVLLSSLAAVAGPAAVAVILSGMGSDGAEGAAEVMRRGGIAMAQDEQSSAIFGMPYSAINHGVDHVLSPAGIGSYLLALKHRPLRRAR
jgi:two-component system, chemotaxis family, protein-glutamate methylesterase/glutaminase